MKATPSPQIIFFPKQPVQYYKDALVRLRKWANSPNPCDEEFCPLCAKATGDLINFVQDTIKKHPESAEQETVNAASA